MAASIVGCVIVVLLEFGIELFGVLDDVLVEMRLRQFGRDADRILDGFGGTRAVRLDADAIDTQAARRRRIHPGQLSFQRSKRAAGKDGTEHGGAGSFQFLLEPTADDPRGALTGFNTAFPTNASVIITSARV